MLLNPVLAILRGVTKEELKELIKVFFKVGIDTVEITMNTKNCEGLIKLAKEQSNGELTIGAGTVLEKEQLNKALNAGVEFIVTPVINEKIIKTCVEQNIPIVPGALTPGEIWKAWCLGATMVKVFPAGTFGPKYFKDVLGPLDKVKLMAVGGVNASNSADYFKAGAKAVAIGGSLITKERLKNNRYDLIESDLKELLQSVPKGNRQTLKC